MGTMMRAALLAALATGPALAQGSDVIGPEMPLLEGYAFETADDGESPPLAHPLDAVAPYWSGHPESMEGGPGLDLTMRTEASANGDVIVVDLMLTGLLDDAVAAERYRALLTPRPGGWFTIATGRQVRCARGGTDEWTVGPCP